MLWELSASLRRLFQHAIHVAAMCPSSVFIGRQCHGGSEVFPSLRPQCIRHITHHQNAADGQFIQISTSGMIAFVVAGTPISMACRRIDCSALRFPVGLLSEGEGHRIVEILTRVRSNSASFLSPISTPSPAQSEARRSPRPKTLAKAHGFKSREGEAVGGSNPFLSLEAGSIPAGHHSAAG